MFVHDQDLIIISDKIRLRPLKRYHYHLALAWYRDKTILWYSEKTDEAFTLATIHRMYDYLSAKGGLYIVEYKETSWKMIGDVTLANDCMPMAIISDYQGLGIGSQVISGLINRARNQGMETIKLSGIYTYNHRSLAMYKKCGFKETHRDDEKIYMEIKL